MSTNQPDTFNNRYILSIAMVSALGGLLFGYDWVVIGGAKPFYEQYFNISSFPSLQGWAVSCALVGCIIGAALPGVISSWFGRKSLLIVSAVFFLISAVGTGGASTFTSFVLFRIFGGIGIGMASNLSPMYIAEISPPKSRGKYVSLNQLTIVIGILLAQVVNWCIAQPMPDQISGPDILQSWNGQRGWRWMFWAEIIPAGVFFILMWFVPESPRWLAARQENDRVKRILRKIGGEHYAQTASKEIELSLQGLARSNRLSDLAHPSIIGIVLIGIVLAVFQQWCGINVIFMYADEIFDAAGYSVSDMLFNIVITGSVNLVFTLVAMSMVDRVGRKFLLLFGSAGLSIIYAVLGTFYFLGIQGWPMLILVVIAIACYAMTLAPVIWVVLSEIFPNRLRGIAMAVATFSLWIASLLLTFFFPIINNKIQASGSFWLFALICGIGYFYIKQKLIETKGKSLEEIEKELTK